MNVKKKKIAVSPGVCLVGLAALFLLLLSIRRDIQASEVSFGEMAKRSMAQELTQEIYRDFIPTFSFVQQGENSQNWLVGKQISVIIPLYAYYNEQAGETHSEGQTEDNYLSLEDILLAEAMEGDCLWEENQAAQEPVMQNEGILDSDGLLPSDIEQGVDTAAQATAFVPRTLQNKVNLQELNNYETLVKYFYTIDKNTMAGSDQLEAAKLAGRDLTISKEGEGPQILIYHTHSQEAFSNSVPGDEMTGIVGVGERLTQILTQQYGYQVLHHTGKYDVESRDDAYSKALPAIEQVLEENPSVQVVIDLHRDAMAEETRLVKDVDGRPTAQFMFFNGLSRTKKTGNIAYLYNENQEDNLAFSFQMQVKATEYYPGLARKIYLKGYRYNMHLRPRTLLIELGAQNNTVEEAMNACDPIAHILDMVLSGTQ